MSKKDDDQVHNAIIEEQAMLAYTRECLKKAENIASLTIDAQKLLNLCSDFKSHINNCMNRGFDKEDLHAAMEYRTKMVYTLNLIAERTQDILNEK